MLPANCTNKGKTTLKKGIFLKGKKTGGKTLALVHAKPLFYQ
jgi:hypothetical protein